MAAPRVLVTRPAHDAAHWVGQLRQCGIDAQALPLIDIVPEPLAGRLLQVRQHLGDYAVAMFVSGNAVTGFMGSNQAAAQLQQALTAIETRAWSPGPGTTAALQRAGWPAARIDQPAPEAPQFDSESLWAQVAPQVRPGLRVLIVRGGDAAGSVAGRDWLAAQLTAAGAEVDQVLAYRRTAPRLDAAGLARAAAAARDGTLWLFSSSEAIAHLRQCLPQIGWQAARALVTHPRIGAAARAAGFGTVHHSQPTLDAVSASIKSLA